MCRYALFFAPKASICRAINHQKEYRDEENVPVFCPNPGRCDSRVKGDHRHQGRTRPLSGSSPDRQSLSRRARMREKKRFRTQIHGQEEHPASSEPVRTGKCGSPEDPGPRSGIPGGRSLCRVSVNYISYQYPERTSMN